MNSEESESPQLEPEETASEVTPDVAVSRPDAAPVTHFDLTEWRGKDLLDETGEKIGRLEDVYFDIETDEPWFGTVKEGFLDRHLTFVPLVDATIGPDYLQVATSRKRVKEAPNIEREGEELSRDDESALFHHYQLNYTPSSAASGRRLVRR